MKQEQLDNLIARGKKLLKKDQPKDALVHLRECVEHDPENHAAYICMAEACLKLNMTDEALAFLLEAQKLDRDNRTTLEQIGTVYFKKGEYDEAYRYFSRAGIDSIKDIASLYKYAESAERTDNKTTQIRILERLLELQSNPADFDELSRAEQEKLKRKLSVLESTKTHGPQKNSGPARDGLSHGEGLRHKPLSGNNGRKKIAVFTVNDYFLRDIMRHLEKRYEVRKFNGSNLSDLAALMRWSDLSWFEWCDNLVVHASKLPKYSKTICRMHRYEVFTDFPGKVNWTNVDHLICVLGLVRDILLERMTIHTPVSIIPNGVDFSKYEVPKDKTYGKKVAYVGYIKKAKGPELLLQCFKKIHDYDPGYTFHVAGKIVDQEIEIYFNHMIKEMNLPVTNYGWMSDIPDWLKDKDYIVSSSISETFMYALVEGIGCGLMPLVHNWPGSENIYPKECLFLTTDDCLALLRKYEHIDKRREAVRLRNTMQERFSLEKQLNNIDALLDQYL